MLKITDLHVEARGAPVLRGVDLCLQQGETHVVMGPNGSGKSTLAHTLAGREGFVITKGRILYKGEDLAQMSPEERAQKGLFLGFQYPVGLPGVTTMTFLKTAMVALARARNEKPASATDLLKRVREEASKLHIPDEMLRRPLNTDFSGGEKKRMEILQMRLFDASLAVLDETDSGLDVDALQMVARAINDHASPERAVLLITHYHRLPEYLSSHRVHILSQGRIARTGGPELAREIDEQGYTALAQEHSSL